MSIYCFVKHEPKPFEDLANDAFNLLHQKLEAGQEPTRQEKDKLVFDTYECLYKRGGWAFDFREFLNIFWVETKYYGIMEVYAWDKTAVRNHMAGNGNPIIKIVEVDND